MILGSSRLCAEGISVAPRSDAGASCKRVPHSAQDLNILKLYAIRSDKPLLLK